MAPKALFNTPNIATSLPAQCRSFGQQHWVDRSNDTDWWRRGSVVKMSVSGWRTFLDLCL